ncbi:hypothetical protein Ancab_017165 [Ancistrocladus abbreviatus]
MWPWSGKHHQSLDGAQTSGGCFQPPHQHGAQTFSSGVQPRSGHKPKFLLPRRVTGYTIPNATPLTNNPIPDPTSLLDASTGKGREAIDQQKRLDVALLDCYLDQQKQRQKQHGMAGYTIPNATPLTNNPIPYPTSLPDYYTERDAALLDYYTGKAGYTIPSATLLTNNPIPDPTSLPDYYTDQQKQREAELSDATPLTNNPIPDPTSLPDYYTDQQKQRDAALLDYYTGKGREAIDQQKQRETELSDATPLTNNPIPDPTSIPDYYTDQQKQRDAALLDYYTGKGREAIDQQKQREAELSERMKPEAELSEGMRVDAEHSAPMKLDAELSERMRLHADAAAPMAHEAKLSERMKPEAELSEHMQLDAEISERGRRSPEPRDPRRSLSPIPGFEMESSENQYDNRSTTIDAAANSVIKSPTYQDSMYKFNGEDPPEITRSTRKDPPTHYRFTISSFKTLRESILRGSCKPGYIESTEFYAANFRWVLLIYPNGNLKPRGKDHLSLYLKMVSQLDQRSSVKATLKFFIYNFHKKAYLIIEGKDETYDVENRQQGIANALPLSDFQDPTFGFMEDESCRIGIEVIIANRVDSGGPRFGHLFLLSRWKESATWEVHDYSELVRDNYATSEEIEMCEWRWQLQLHPKGSGKFKNERLSLFLNLLNFFDLTNGKKLYVEKKFCIKNLKGGRDFISTTSSWYSESVRSDGDYLATLADLSNSEKGLIDSNMMVIQVTLECVFFMDTKVHDN